MEIQGFPDYLVYEDGRVFSKKSRKMLKPVLTQRGYYDVMLYNDGKYKHHPIHRLIATYYIDNPNKYKYVDHIDRDKTNNDISNLRWCDNSTNQQNTPVSRNNKLRIKNISPHSGGYIFQKMNRGKRISKWFKTLEEALAYKSTIDS